jgi:hypothetical protein
VQYEKLSDENVGLGRESKTLETGLDSHTKDNREKRKTLRALRDDLANVIDAIGRSATEGPCSSSTRAWRAA